MKTLKLVPKTPDFQFVRHNRRAFLISVVLIIGSLVTFFMQGLNFGIDFRGGILIEISSEEPVDIAALRNRMQTLDLGEVQIQQFGTPTDVLIRVAEAEDAVSTERDLSAVDAMRQELEGEFEIRRVEIVGPQVSRELIQTGAMKFHKRLMIEFQFYELHPCLQYQKQDLVLHIPLFELMLRCYRTHFPLPY